MTPGEELFSKVKHLSIVLFSEYLHKMWNFPDQFYICQNTKKLKQKNLNTKIIPVTTMIVSISRKLQSPEEIFWFNQGRVKNWGFTHSGVPILKKTFSPSITHM